ncbi:MAG: hypothetical protein HOJ28_01085 [Candidatus Thioglobus sp.]|jgi:hypothetical protein|nr:hypothetical protein [Candidatus Thioglobus sp.]
MIISRQEAIKRGLNKYYTGEPCINDHYAERYVQSHTCVKCKQMQKKKQREDQKQERLKKHGGNNQKRYFTGEPCSKGHVAERFISNGHCVECKKEQGEVYRRRKGTESREVKTQKIAKKKKKEREQYKKSLLNSQEKSIAEYARTCLSRLNGRSAARIPTEIAEIECGYTSSELHDYLRKQKKGWGARENRGRWHIDHIIPISKLIKFGVTEVSILNSLDNLKLMTAKQNLKKSSKLRLSRKRFEEYVVSKWASCSQVLGMYNPRERRRRMVNELVDKIYNNLNSDFLQHSDFYKQNKEAIIQAIKDDLYDGTSYRYSDGVTSKQFINNLLEYSSGHLDKLMLDAYKPLNKIKNKKFKKFKYKDECEEYFNKIAAQQSNLICKRYIERQTYDRCKPYQNKGFIRRLFN